MPKHKKLTELVKKQLKEAMEEERRRVDELFEKYGVDEISEEIIKVIAPTQEEYAKKKKIEKLAGKIFREVKSSIDYSTISFDLSDAFRKYGLEIEVLKL